MNNTVKIEKDDEKVTDEAKSSKSPAKKRAKPKMRERVPFNKQKRIGIEQEEGYHYRLFNDVGDRIARARKAGYEVIDAPIREGDICSSDSSQLGKVAKQSVGNGLEAYYMRIPQEWHDEYEKKKQKELDETDTELGLDKIPEHIRRGKVKVDYGPLEK